MTITKTMGGAAVLLALLAAAHVLPAADAMTSSAAETILAFRATMPADTRRHRALLNRPDTTCDNPAMPKDKEVGAINEFLFCVADTLGVPRSQATAFGLQITEGARIFTVMVLGNTKQLEAYADGALCLLTASDGRMVVAGSYHPVSYDGGNKQDLAANLMSLPPGGPITVVACDFFAGIDVNALKPETTTTPAATTTARRHLLVAPTDDELDIWEDFIEDMILTLSTETGIPVEQWTAQGLDIENGGQSASFVLFVRASPTAFGGMVSALSDEATLARLFPGGGVELGTPVKLAEKLVPAFNGATGLRNNLLSPVNPDAVRTIVEVNDAPAATVLPPDDAPPPSGSE